MQKGDIFIVEVDGNYQAYKYFEKHVVKPEDTDFIQPQAGKELATLLTCTPYMINTHRLLVTGERVPFTPSMLKDMANIKKSHNLQDIIVWGSVAVALIGSIALLVHFWKTMRMKRRHYNLRFKVMNETGEEPLYGAAYQLFTSNGKIPLNRDGELFISKVDSKNGEVDFGELPGGKYMMKQVDTPAHYHHVKHAHFVVKKVKAENFEGRVKKRILHKRHFKHENGIFTIHNPKAQ
jgi:sortase A